MRAAARRYGLAALLVLASILFRLALQRWVGASGPYLEFFPAILVAAWYGGFGPGVAATLASGAATFAVVGAPGTSSPHPSEDLVSLGLFLLTGTGIAWFNHRLRQAEAAHRDEAALGSARAQELRVSDARWHAVAESAVDGMIVIDARGRIEAFNPAAERLFGYAEQDVVGQNVNVLMPSPYREQHDAYLARYLATGEKRIIGLGREVVGLRRNGSTFPVHLSVGEMSLQGDRKFVGTLHDLTARTAVEQQLREQAALARLGEMAAVVAHEVKNPLAGIRGAIQIIGGRLPPGTDASIVNEIIGRIDALSEMMASLLLFARPPAPRVGLVDVNALVAATAELLSKDSTLRDLEVHVEGYAPAVTADPNLLQIVFHNLLVNGAHAMQGKGQIRVSIGQIDSICLVTFADSGPGMPAEVREKIFTPFFTTKARGSGLGLPTSKRLVEAHKGRLIVDCPPSGGTRVTVELPLAPASDRSPTP